MIEGPPATTGGAHQGLGDLLAGVAGPTALLMGATALHKLATFAFGLQLGRLAGAEGLGLAATIWTVGWVAGTLAGLGLPDRATVRASEDRGAGRALGGAGGWAGREHGRFLLAVGGVHAALVLAAPWIGGAPGLPTLARGLALGSGLHGLSALALSAARGYGRPGVEIASTALAALALGGGAWLAGSPEALGAAWSASGALMLLGAASLTARTPGLRPRPAAPEAGSLPWLALGVGAWLLGNLDLLIARAALSPEAIGHLQAGSILTRSAGLLPWLLSSLALHRLQRAWARGERGPAGALAGASAVLGAALGAGGLVALPWLAMGYALPLEAIVGPGRASLLTAPALFLALSAVPAAAARDLRRALGAIGLGVAAAFAASGALLAGAGGALSGPTAAALGLAAGQAVAAAALYGGILLRRPTAPA